MHPARKFCVALSLALAILAIQQIYNDATGGSIVYAQNANIDAGDVTGAPGSQVALPVTFANNTPPDVGVLNFAYSFDDTCLRYDGFTNETPGLLTCLNGASGIVGCLKASATTDPLPDGQFASLLFTLTDSPSCNNQTFDIVAYVDPNLPPDAYLCVDDVPNNVDCTQTDGAITNDTTLAVTLGWFLAESNGDSVAFQWQTVTESGVAGFNILAETEAGLVQLNEDLIASPVIDAVSPTDYLASLVTDATRFYLQEVGINGRVVEHGPFVIDEENGTPSAPHVTPSVWLPLFMQ